MTALSALRAFSKPPLVMMYLLRAAANHEAPHISLRLARRNDIPGIAKVNLATLPENYSAQFYVQHLASWPQLALVAEYQDAVDPNNLAAPPPNPPSVVGYVLGRMEAPPPVASGRAYYASDMSANSAAQSAAARQGHITSLAVLPEFRRLGLAAGLMEEVQKQMEVAHGGEAVSLHVRCSNAAALRLYGPNGLGYRVEQTIERYYADGEDAYLMKCRLQPHLAQLQRQPQHQQQQPPQLQQQPQFQRSPPMQVQGTDWLRMGCQSSSAGSQPQQQQPARPALRQVHEAQPLRAPPPPRALPGSAYKGGLHRTA